MGDRVGIIIEVKDGRLKKANYEVITVCRGDGRELYALLFDGAGALYKKPLQEYGVHKIVEIGTDRGPLAWNPETWAQAILGAVEKFGLSTVIGLSSAKGRDLLPRVAAALEAPLVLDCQDVDLARRTAVKSQFSGRTKAKIKLTGKHYLYGLRPNVVTAQPAPVQAEIIAFPASAGQPRLTIVETRPGETRGVDLSEADIIISGGRAMASKENFKILRACAEVMTAAVGASRAAVDSGYASQDMQVGQTGKTVSPNLYLACGISGSIQHFAGMKTSKIIAAVNNDPEAQIFEKCDYGLLGDLFEVVPLLTQKLARALGRGPAK
ncbi:MAG: electron transfer flavoprotein subunit alpha/FixB family protein [Thermodesulfobacteriota bacterium]